VFKTSWLTLVVIQLKTNGNNMKVYSQTKLTILQTETQTTDINVGNVLKVWKKIKL